MKNKAHDPNQESFFKIIPDKDSKTLTILTSGGKSVIVNDNSNVIAMEDQYGNSIQLDSSGITIPSQKDIRIKAIQKCQIGGSNLEIEGQNKLEAKGTAVLINANSTFHAVGNASAEIRSSGHVSVNGTMVMIK